MERKGTLKTCEPVRGWEVMCLCRSASAARTNRARGRQHGMPRRDRDVRWSVRGRLKPANRFVVGRSCVYAGPPRRQEQIGRVAGNMECRVGTVMYDGA